MRQWLTGGTPDNSPLIASFRCLIDELFPPKRNIRGIPVRYAGPETNGFPARTLRNRPAGAV